MILKDLLLFESKLYDFRHVNVEKDLTYWGGKRSEWVDPSVGFYWEYVKGKLKIFSTDNSLYSFIASDPEKIKEMNAGSATLTTILRKHKDENFESWNKLGGLVHYADKTITIAKESLHDKMRQRIVHDIKEFQAALKALMEHDKRITPDYIIKGTAPRVGKTIKQALQGEPEPLTSKKTLVMYHGTSSVRMNAILKFGLRPGLQYGKYFTSKDEVEKVLAKLGITVGYIIRDDLTVDMTESVKILAVKLEKIPVQFHHVSGEFNIRGNRLKSLKGCPEYVGAAFNCGGNPLVSLKYAPDHVGENFTCSETRIKSLEESPSYVGGDFYCPETQIESLHNIHKQVKHIGGTFFLSYTIKSHILGVMFIKGLQQIGFQAMGPEQEKQKQAMIIINRYLSGSRNPHECQEELIEAGLSEYAKL